MNVKGMDIKDMIWMENSKFQGDLYCVVFMGIKQNKTKQNI